YSCQGTEWYGVYAKWTCVFLGYLVACGAKFCPKVMAKDRCGQASRTPGSPGRKHLYAQEFKGLQSCFVSVAKKSLNGGR
uniref:Uncharacterized protein n=1 Tax=Moschus moschiferus TaxID=68415 RepID=A0A8C6FVX0_MOSMO